MLSKIANIIHSYLEPLPFITKSTGLIKEMKIKTGTKTKTVPVDLYASLAECQSSTEKYYVPDSKQTGIIYFEDKGIRGINADSHYVNFEANLRIVGWFNMNKIGQTNTTLIALNLINAIPDQLPNTDFMVKMAVEFTGEEVKSAAIFSKYSYDEYVNFLNKPYDYLALNYKVKFSVSRKCIPELELNPVSC